MCHSWVPPFSALFTSICVRRSSNHPVWSAAMSLRISSRTRSGACLVRGLLRYAIIILLVQVVGAVLDLGIVGVAHERHGIQVIHHVQLFGGEVFDDCDVGLAVASPLV